MRGMKHDIPSSLIQLKKLTMQYQEGNQQRTILNAVDAFFPQGKFSVLLGQSGSGKSTLLNLIAGLDQPDHGEVWVANQNMTTMSEQERTLFRREHIGFVFQFFNLLPTLSLLENVILPLQLNKVKHAKTIAMEWLERVGLADRYAAYPDRLSGGEQQRVAIARAMLHQPMLVLADEPTGNLDTRTGDQITELLLELVKAEKQTLVMVTHNPAMAAFADKVYVLEGQKLHEKNG
jgi:putative ABC transport system ATP-binding protein